MIHTFHGGLRTLPAQVWNFGGGADLDPPPNQLPPKSPQSNFGEGELRAVTVANIINPELRG